MRIDIITIFPGMFNDFLSHSIISRAIQKKKAEIYIHNLRDYSNDKHKSVDDYMYGGGAGMVMMIEPIANCIEYLQSQRNYDEVIYLTPDGEKLNQKTCNRLSLLQNIILLAGHYKGVDQRVRDIFVTKEISIGDYVLTGGELPAMVLTDAIVRLLPGVLNDETSALTDSFQDNLLSPPIYTRPSDFRGYRVPDVLLSGNFKAIEEWRLKQAIEKTRRLRPDLFDNLEE
ncbi:MAG: tRNA (guanine-N(1)-)-methyltransferase [Vicingaceae bacterium]|nr:MAG: tRNA (guanine-N(1)-)-methyltransferase [Vicingaceae bacterium]